MAYTSDARGQITSIMQIAEPVEDGMRVACKNYEWQNARDLGKVASHTHIYIYIVQIGKHPSIS